MVDLALLVKTNFYSHLVSYTNPILHARGAIGHGDRRPVGTGAAPGLLGA
jgi:hypothetical protein